MLHTHAQILDQIHDSVVTTDLDGYVTGWNMGAQRMFGYTAEEAVGRHISFVYPPEQHQFLREKIIAPLKAQGGHEAEVIMRRKSGEDFFAHLSLSLLKDPSGKPTHMIGYSIDITDRKRMETELESRSLHQLVLNELSQFALSGADLSELLDETVSRVARTLQIEFCEIWKYIPQEENLLLQASYGWNEELAGIARLDARPNSQGAFILDSGEPVIIEDLPRETRFDPASLFVEQGMVSGVGLVIYDNITPYGILGVHMNRQNAFSPSDVNFLESVATLLTLAIQRLHVEQHLAYQANILDNVHEAIIAVDKDYTLTAWNKAAESIYGWTESEVLGRSLFEVLPTEGTGSLRLDQIFQTLLTDEVYETELNQTTKDGHPIQVYSVTNLLKDEKGSVRGFFCVNRNISRRKQAEQAQKDSEALLDQNSERLSNLWEISRAILSAKSLEEIAESSLRQLRKILPYQVASVAIFNYNTSTASLASIYPQNDLGEKGSTKLPLDIFNDLAMLRTGKVDQFENTHKAGQLLSVFGKTPMQDCSIFCFPLISQDELIGALNLAIGTIQPLPTGWKEIASEVADSMAIVIKQNRLLDQLRIANRQLRQLSQQIVAAQEAERQRISRELHDEAGQALTALKIGLELIQSSLPEESTYLHNSIQEVKQLAENTMRQIRGLAHHLRPPELEALGLNPVLEEQCRNIDRHTSLFVQYSGVDLPELDDSISICLYRVLQEALTNVLKHSNAMQVQVSLEYEEGIVRLTVKDNGKGFLISSDGQFSDQHEGIGLLGMRERLELLRGRLDIISEPGKGTILVASLPAEDLA